MKKITLLFTIIIDVIQITSAQTFTAGSFKYRVIKDGVSVIGEMAFWECQIPDSVT